jgi:two-component system, LytTR family, response regulator AlgR
MTEPLRTIIVDDEPLAVERMMTLCRAEPGLNVIGTAHNGHDALGMIKALSPDLIFLDIAMPELDGLGVARALEQANIQPAIVFVTAFDGFAVQAFDVSAADYLLKPVAPDRLSRAVERAVAKRGDTPTPPAEASDEFWVPHRSELIRVRAADIDRIDAERDYMRLHVGPRSYLLHQTIAALEERLDPELFIRVHRSVIIRRDRITGLGHDRAGAWHAELADGSQVRIGRTYLAKAKALAGR